MRFTKIVCTLGPSSRDPATLEQLIRAGLDVARINFSHGEHDEHAQTIRTVRALAERLKRPIAILGDLQGPKLRVGALPAPGLPLRVGTSVLLSTDPDRPDAIPVQYHDLPQLVGPGDRLLIDDGLLELEVEATTPDSIRAKIIIGGTLFAHKGINLPRADIRIPAITAKDEVDLRFAIAQELDWIALSFVRTAHEVLDLKAMIRRHSRAAMLPQVIAKIEKPEAVENIEAILQATDGVMVARGDLGIELPSEDVPMVQKHIIRLCNLAGKPVITATQMLDSMIRNPRPTRAEASDVANAVLDGTDAVMLSAETAAGKYPVQTVQVMGRIILRAEAGARANGTAGRRLAPLTSPSQAIGYAASELAAELGAAAIIAPTVSGFTARQLARHRPIAPVIAVTPSDLVCRQLNLLRGVCPLRAPRRQSTDEVIEDALETAQAAGFVHEGDLVVITGGAAGTTPGATNMIRLQFIPPVLARGTGIGSHLVRGRAWKLATPLPPSLKLGPADILVAPSLDETWLGTIASAGGIVVENGDAESYAVTIARELNVPALVGAAGAVEAIDDGEAVVLDPMHGIVHRAINLDQDRRSSESLP